jgi:hypothetical protein
MLKWYYNQYHKGENIMKSKIAIVLSVIIALSVVFSGCTVKQPDVTAAPTATVDFQSLLDLKDTQISAITVENETLKKQIKSLKSSTALNLALTIITLIKDKDATALESYIHPVKGVRFSPYAFVNTGTDRSYSAAQILTFFTDATAYNWGSYDGSGLPIQLDNNGYYDKFIYDVDFEIPHLIGVNTEIGKGNTPNNIAAVYPGDVFIEFHFNGFDPQYSGMDWKSLRLVFEDLGGTLYLVGVVHAQWTI